MINKLNIKNIKGMTKSFTLGKVTHISGDNGGGKSTIIDALKLLIIGYHPDVGKQAGRMMALASGDCMEVSGHGDNGFSVSRSWEYKKGKVSSTTMPKDYAPDPQTVMTLDHSEYFGKTDSQRVEMIYNMFGPKEYDIQGFIDRLKLAEIEGDQELVQQAIDAVFNSVPESVYNQPPQFALESLGEYLSGLATGVRKNVKSYKATVETLTDLRVFDEQIQRLPIRSEVDQKKESINARIIDLNRNQATLKAQLQSYDNNTARMGELESMLEDAEDSATDIKASEARVAELQTQIDDLEKEKTNISANLDEANRFHAEDSATLKSIIARIRELESEKEDLAKEGATCPVCGSDREGWKDEAFALIDGKISDLRKQIEVKQTDIAKHQHSVSKSASAKSALSGKLDTLRINLRNENAQLRLLTGVASKLASAKEELARIKENIVHVDSSQLESLTSQIEELKTESRILDESLEILNKLENDRKRTEDAVNLLTLEELKYAVVEKSVKSVAEEKKQLVAQAYGPVLEIANRFLDGVFDWSLSYSDGYIGRMNGTYFIDYRTFSGSEKQLVFMAVMIGVAAGSNMKIGIIDELANFTPERKTAVIRNLIKLTDDGTLSQAIVLEPLPYTGEPDKVTLITV